MYMMCCMSIQIAWWCNYIGYQWSLNLFIWLISPFLYFVVSYHKHFWWFLIRLFYKDDHHNLFAQEDLQISIRWGTVWEHKLFLIFWLWSGLEVGCASFYLWEALKRSKKFVKDWEDGCFNHLWTWAEPNL